MIKIGLVSSVNFQSVIYIRFSIQKVGQERKKKGEPFHMKILGLFFTIAIVVIGYSAYDSMVVNPTDVIAEVTGTSSSGGCKGPFGVDSQKILNKGTLAEYRHGLVNELKYHIGYVTKIDLEKNHDGSWYIDNCELSKKTKLYFTRPYPQQNDFKVGDYIGVEAMEGKRGEVNFLSAGRLLENISKQSANCNVEDISQLSVPSRTMSPDATEKDFVSVTGIVMAVKTIRNSDPEPEDPSDHHIRAAVMKCGVGELYRLVFLEEWWIGKSMEEINLIPPAPEAFGEGDVVTVQQMTSAASMKETYGAWGSDERQFAAAYKQK